MSLGPQTTLNFSEFVPELFASYAIPEFDRQLVLLRQLTDLSQLFVDNPGNKLQIPIFPNLGLGDVADVPQTDNATYASQATDDASVTLQIDKFKYASRAVTPQLAKYSSPRGLAEMIGAGLGRLLARYLDYDLAGLYAASDHPAVDLTMLAAMDDEEVLKTLSEAVTCLDNFDIPQEGRAFLLCPKVYNRLRTLEQFASYDYAARRALANGVLGEIFGIPVIKTTNLQTSPGSGSTVTHNLLLHQSAGAFAIPGSIRILMKNTDFNDAHFVNAKITARVDYGYVSLDAPVKDTHNVKNYSIVDIVS